MFGYDYDLGQGKITEGNFLKCEQILLIFQSLMALLLIFHPFIRVSTYFGGLSSG
jgi:hypothetical protein